MSTFGVLVVYSLLTRNKLKDAHTTADVIAANLTYFLKNGMLDVNFLLL